MIFPFAVFKTKIFADYRSAQPHSLFNGHHNVNAFWNEVTVCSREKNRAGKSLPTLY